MGICFLYVVKKFICSTNLSGIKFPVGNFIPDGLSLHKFTTMDLLVEGFQSWTIWEYYSWRIFGPRNKFLTLGKVKKFLPLGLRPRGRNFLTFPWVRNLFLGPKIRQELVIPLWKTVILILIRIQIWNKILLTLRTMVWIKITELDFTK